MGAFAGAGQGAGINALKSLSGSDVALTEAQKEEEAKLKARQSQDLEDGLFIDDAMAIDSEVAKIEFGEKWAEQLGITEEEVFNDPRFATALQNIEEIKQEGMAKDLRFKHRDSFPDEGEWNKEHEAEIDQRQRANLANPNSELGAAFAAWSKANDVYDTSEQTIEDFLSTPEVMDLLAEDNIDEGRAPYLSALDGHAAFKEQEAGRTAEESAQVLGATASLLEAYNTAISEGNVLGVATAEQAALEQLSPAEWANAKRNNKALKR